MKHYLQAVTLGAFTWKNPARLAALSACMRTLGFRWTALHFLLVTLCLNFPATFIISALSPHELLARLHGDTPAAPAIPGDLAPAIDAFNTELLENGYGSAVLLPVLVIAFALTLLIQTAFYLCTAFFLGLARLHGTVLGFRERLGLAVFSSTLPVLAASLLGMVLPTVHIIVFYFIVMALVFQRSRALPEVTGVAVPRERS